MDLKKLSPANWFKHEPQVAEKDNSTPVHPITQMHQEMDRIFNQAFRGFGLPSSRFLSEEWPGVSGLDFDVLRPNLDIKEDPERFTVSVEMPGVEKEDVHVELNGHDLLIKGEKKQEETKEDEGYHCVERRFGSFQRVLHLPETAQVESLTAKFENGVLILSVAKAALVDNSENRKVEVK